MINSGGPLDNQTWQTEWKTAPLVKVQLCEYENQNFEVLFAASRWYAKFDCPMARQNLSLLVTVSLSPSLPPSLSVSVCLSIGLSVCLGKTELIDLFTFFFSPSLPPSLLPSLPLFLALHQDFINTGISLLWIRSYSYTTLLWGLQSLFKLLLWISRQLAQSVRHVV